MAVDIEAAVSLIEIEYKSGNILKSVRPQLYQS
jgi:hypothetical protein